LKGFVDCDYLNDLLSDYSLAAQYDDKVNPVKGLTRIKPNYYWTEVIDVAKECYLL
jgi:hypothetical protein